MWQKALQAENQNSDADLPPLAAPTDQPHRKTPMSSAKYTAPSKPESHAVPTSGDRAELAAYAVREALLDIVWSNVDIPRAMKGVVARGLAASSYSKKFDAERILIGTELRPQWPEAPQDGALVPFAVLDQYGPAFEQTPEADAEFLRMHALRQYGHLIYSDDDMPKLSGMAHDAGASAETFGLLETIRVERRMGISLGRSFEWENYYPIDEAGKLPAVDRPLFHWLRDGWRLPLRANPGQEALLADFYDRLVGAVDSREVADLAVEWRDKVFPEAFPKPESEPEQSQQDGDGDGKDKSKKETPSNDKPGSSRPGSGSPGQGGASTDGEPSTEPSEDADDSKAPQSGDKASGDRKPGDEPVSEQADPYGTQNERKPGESSLMSHIASGLKRDAKADEATAKAGAGKPGAGKPGEGKAGAGKDGKDGKDGMGEGATMDIAPPTTHEAQAQRGHEYSQGASNADASPPAPGEWRTIPKNVELLEGSTDYFAANLFGQRRRATVNKEEATKARRILERMLTGQSRNVLSDSPSKRISMRHMARGEIKFNKREDFSRGSMNIDMVVDCSGSMNGKPIDSARSLISALSDLAAKGLLAGRVIFSSGEGWMACPLPMKQEKIELICAFSNSEGIQRALTDNVRRLRTADAVFVYTDAQITDRSFDKSELRARKVEPMGLYVGPESAEHEMRGYFDRYLIRENLEELCLGMVQRFISQRKLVLATQAKKSKMRR